MHSPKGRNLVDALLAAAVVYLSLWVYEVANWLSLTLAGVNASIVMGGWLPAGVLGVSTNSSLLAIAKPLQVFLSLSLAGFGFAVFRKHKLPVTRFVLLCTMSVYLASVYWELLSVLSFIPVTFHEGVFFALSFATLNILLLANRRFQ
ncbi:MAG: hypothetical protein OK422_00195 [Thaumarchaeota archaeon]|nr:hypothetical protein [Nitrososphaerota archaeon]